MASRQYGARRKAAEHGFFKHSPEVARYEEESNQYKDSPEVAGDRFKPNQVPCINNQTECPETETALNGPLRLKYSDFVGDTPLIDLTHLVPNCKPGVKLYAKPEFLNPGFSIKDRIAKHIIESAEIDGVLKSGATVVAASSGNTGAATALFCAAKGYKCVVTTSEKCSREKQEAIAAYGSEVTVCDDSGYMSAARDWALERGWFDMDQYDNLLNPQAHELSTGDEIWKQTSGAVTHVVAAGSTGGTITGIAECLKSRESSIQIVLADPVGSIFAEAVENNGNHGKGSSFLVEGVGKKSIPGAMNLSYIDKVVQVTDQQAFSMCHLLARSEGLCAGGSSGLNVFAAVSIASQLEEGIVVTILPDGGAKYLSKVYSPEYLHSNNIELLKLPTRDPVPSAFPLYRDLVGDTPLAELTHLLPDGGAFAASIGVRVLGKIEFFNPAFSASDRLMSTAMQRLRKDPDFQKKIICDNALHMCSCAMFAGINNVECVIDVSRMSNDIYKSQIDMCHAYGATILRDLSEIDISPYTNICHLMKSIQNDTLATELMDQTYGALSHVVAEDPSILCQQSLSENVRLLHAVPQQNSKLFTTELSRVYSKNRISDEKVVQVAHMLTKREGLLCGRRSALNVALALEFANSIENGPACIVAIMPDLGIHDLSTVYSNEWVQQNMH